MRRTQTVRRIHPTHRGAAGDVVALPAWGDLSRLTGVIEYGTRVPLDVKCSEEGGGF